MTDSDHPRWHPTHSGGNRGPVVWKLTGGEVFLLAGGLGTGFLAFMLLSSMGWSFTLALAVASAIPLGVLAVLLTLVCGKPAGHFFRFIEWHCLRKASRNLITLNSNKKSS